jgi:hypothetical protein
VRFSRRLSPPGFRSAPQSGGYGPPIAPSAEMFLYDIYIVQICAGALDLMFSFVGERKYSAMEVHYAPNVRLVIRFRPSRIEWLLQARTASI